MAAFHCQLSKLPALIFIMTTIAMREGTMTLDGTAPYLTRSTTTSPRLHWSLDGWVTNAAVVYYSFVGASTGSLLDSE